MARVTIEDCLREEENRFALVHMTAKRVRQLIKGSKPLVNVPDNRDVVVALREIAAGEVVKRGKADTYDGNPEDTEKEELHPE